MSVALEHELSQIYVDTKMYKCGKFCQKVIKRFGFPKSDS